MACGRIRTVLAIAAVTVLVLPASAPADVIVSTDFAGRTASGKTASNILWTTNGVQDPGDLTFVPEGPPLNTNLFNTADAQGHFAPDMNVGNESPWSVTVPLTLTATQVSLEDVVIDWQHFTNAGAFQGPSRSVDWTASVTGSSSGTVGSVTAANVGGTSGVETLTFSAPLTLSNSETWGVKIHAQGSNTTGNNTGLDGLTLNGEVGPGGGPGPGPATYEETVRADSPFAYYRLNEATGPTATNLGTVGAPLNGSYNNASGFSFQQPSLLPSGEDLSVLADGATAGGGTELRLPDNAALNTGAHDNKTVELWFQADSITSTRTVLYEQGGNTRGINIYLQEVGGEDTLFMGAWNLAESNWPVTFVEKPVSEDTPYHAVFVLDGDPDDNDGTDDGIVRGYLNGELIDAITGAGNLRAHGNNTAAMGIFENVRYADGATQGDGANVAGYLDELALYNIKLDDPNDDDDLSDSRVLVHYNAGVGAADVIPEPATLSLLGLGGLLALRRRRRSR